MKNYYCPVEVMVDAIGGKWKTRILWHLSHRPARYGELKRLIPEITKKMLAQFLKELEEHELTVRSQQMAGNILTVEYRLTDYGQKLTPMLQLMSEWGKEHYEKRRIDDRKQG